MRHVADVAIPHDLKLLYAIIDRAFWPWLMAWWRESRDAKNRHRPRAHVDFIAHPTRLIPVYHPAKPESRTFDGHGEE